MGIVQDITEFGAGLREHLSRHGVLLDAARAVPAVSDLFALFAAPAHEPEHRPWLRMRTASV
jgi:hypothetical protein